MSFEQIEQQLREEKKKKSLDQERQTQFFLEKQIRNESTQMIQKLALEIAKEFWIDISKAKDLISGKTEDSLDTFKSDLDFPEIAQRKKFEDAILQAREILKDISKKKREAFRQSIEDDIYRPEEYTYTLSPILFWNRLIQRGKNPQNINDQLLGAGIGLFDSTEAIILFTYALWKWILLTPYHIYLILSGKGSYDGWKKI